MEGGGGLVNAAEAEADDFGGLAAMMYVVTWNVTRDRNSLARVAKEDFCCCYCCSYRQQSMPRRSNNARSAIMVMVAPYHRNLLSTAVLSFEAVLKSDHVFRFHSDTRRNYRFGFFHAAHAGNRAQQQARRSKRLFHPNNRQQQTAAILLVSHFFFLLVCAGLAWPTSLQTVVSEARKHYGNG